MRMQGYSHTHTQIFESLNLSEVERRISLFGFECDASPREALSSATRWLIRLPRYAMWVGRKTEVCQNCVLHVCLRVCLRVGGWRGGHRQDWSVMSLWRVESWGLFSQKHKELAAWECEELGAGELDLRMMKPEDAESLEPEHGTAGHWTPGIGEDKDWGVIELEGNEDRKPKGIKHGDVPIFDKLLILSYLLCRLAIMLCKPLVILGRQVVVSS